MAQAGSILANVRVLAGDPDRDFITDAIGLDWINQSQKRFCHLVMPLDEVKDYTLTGKEWLYDLPTDAIMPIWALWYKTRSVKLQYKPPDRWAFIMEGWPNATGVPDCYTVIRRQLNLGPQVYQSDSATALTSGAMSTTTTTPNLTAASGTFRKKGWLKIGSEILEYTDVATTTVTGVTRGVHNTTAASYASGTKITEVDLQLLYRRKPADISATGTSPDIPEAYHDYIEKYVLYLAWLARGDTAKAEAALAEFEKYESETKKTIGRRSQDGLIQIQDRWRSRWY